MKERKGWDLEIETCAEEVDLSEFGIGHNACIDGELMARLFPDDDELMEYLGYGPMQLGFMEQLEGDSRERNRQLKDKGQRLECGCIRSKDIGQYNTCGHGCIYCYANTSPEAARRNLDRVRPGHYPESMLANVDTD
jgi:hypothetical protein